MEIFYFVINIFLTIFEIHSNEVSFFFWKLEREIPLWVKRWMSCEGIEPSSPEQTNRTGSESIEEKNKISLRQTQS